MDYYSFDWELQVPSTTLKYRKQLFQMIPGEVEYYNDKTTLREKSSTCRHSDKSAKQRSWFWTSSNRTTSSLTPLNLQWKVSTFNFLSPCVSQRGLATSFILCILWYIFVFFIYDWELLDSHVFSQCYTKAQDECGEVKSWSIFGVKFSKYQI